MKKLVILSFFFSVLVAAQESDKRSFSVDSLPAVVVATSPQSGQADVDPTKTKKVSVTFSKEMRDKTWSWSQISSDTFPKIEGKPRYLDDQKTCEIDVELEPGKVYAIWVNSSKFGNFKDRNGKSAVPYLLVFETK